MAQEKSKIEQLQEAMLTLQYQKLAREEADLEQKQQEQQAARLIGINALNQERQMELERQSVCPHLKPNAQPAIGGQWDHQGHYHWTCLYCAKEWMDLELPVHLRIDSGRVGGPSRN